jgi:hypothetical protein
MIAPDPAPYAWIGDMASEPVDAAHLKEESAKLDACMKILKERIDIVKCTHQG